MYAAKITQVFQLIMSLHWELQSRTILQCQASNKESFLLCFVLASHILGNTFNVHVLLKTQVCLEDFNNQAIAEGIGNV